jgi:CheY-like chemotaxis protein
MEPTVPQPVTTILVVDDEPAMREVLELRLAEWGFRVALAGSAAEADREVIRAAPDLVISDVVLPVSGSSSPPPQDG